MSKFTDRELLRMAELWLLGLASALDAAESTKLGPSLIAAMGAMTEAQAKALLFYIAKLKEEKRVS